MGNFKNVIQGILAFILGIIITFVSWFLIPPLINYIEDPVIRAIGWIGLITVWILAVIVVPAFKITSGLQKDTL